MQWTFFLPLFLASSSLIVFWLIYRLVLAKLTHFKWQRGYLLFSVIFSCIFPFIPRFSNWLPSFLWNDSLSSTNLIESLPLNPITESMTTLEQSVAMTSTIDMMVILGGTLALIYLTGVILKLLFFVDKVSVIRQLIVSNPKEKVGEEWLITLPETGTAFSFFHYLFLTQTLAKLSKQEVAQIITHEQIHSQQKHSLDIILIEIAEIFLWFHPVIYRFKNNLKDIHEYLADEAMIQRKTVKKTYAQLLLKLANPLTVNSLTTGFNHKQIGRRITMLATTPSASYHKLKFLLMIPIIASLLLFSACFGEEPLSPVSELNSVLTQEQKDNLNKSRMYVIEEVNWQGSKVLTEAELSNAINIRAGDKIHSSVFNQRLENIELSKIHLKDLYAEKGHLFGGIRVERYYFRDTKLSITISVTEQKGPILKIGAITWEGNTVFSERKLNDVLGLNKGDNFNEEFLDLRLHYNSNWTDVTSLYMNKGYAYFSVEVEKKQRGDIIDLTFKLFEGMEVSIANISISGNETIASPELMEKINIKEGELFSRSKIIAAQESLIAMGKFDPKQIGINTLILQENNQLMNIDFTLVELK